MGAAIGAAEPIRRRSAAQVERSLLHTDLIFGGISLVIVVASILLTPSESAVAIFGWELPGICMFRNLTGMDCLGCGLTRSFVFAGHLDIRSAFDRHMLGPILYLLVATQVPYRAWRAVGRWARLRALRASEAPPPPPK